MEKTGRRFSQMNADQTKRQELMHLVCSDLRNPRKSAAALPSLLIVAGTCSRRAAASFRTTDAKVVVIQSSVE